MESFWIKAKGYIIGGVAFIGLTFIYVGLGPHGHKFNLLILLIGIFIITPFAIWFMVIVFKTKKLNRAKEKRIQNLIKHGDKILIDLQNIKILNNSWNQEIVTKDKLDHVDINLNYFELQIPYKNDKIKYKIHIDMELDKLKTYLALKGKTFFYVDPNNINNRHLDLDFLDIK